MSIVMKFDPRSSLEDTVREIHRQFAEAETSKKREYSCRVRAGNLLISLRTRIEAGEAGEGVGWWDWYASKFVRSRRDAEKVMALAVDDDPEAAAEEERARNRDAKRRSRAATADVSRSIDADLQPREEEKEPRRDLVLEALSLVEQMTKYQRRRFFGILRETYDASLDT